MVHERLSFTMPAAADVVFDVFHYHQWRVHWDSLVESTEVVGGAPCPSVGAVSENAAGGLLRGLRMRTEFLTYDRPRLAAARMVGKAFPFARWATSMKHEPIDRHHSLLIYTYTLETGPSWLRWLMEPVVGRYFSWQTRKRFARMHAFLERSAPQVETWQRSFGYDADTTKQD